MTTILALETSRSLCSVAVRQGAELIEDTRKVERLHNEVVLTMVDAVCKSAGLARRGIDVVAFGAGPGSFTGVRIAAAVAQGIAFGAGRHFCPGQPLAKLEAKITIEEVFKRMKNIRLKDKPEDIKFHDWFVVRGPNQMNIEFDVVE